MHTEMNSGFRLVPRMGMNSALGGRKHIKEKDRIHTQTHVHTLSE